MASVRFEVAGQDITSDVMIADASFTSRVNGAPGEFTMKVKDPTHSYAFVSGSVVRVFIDDVCMFTGFITRPKRGFAMDVVDTVSNPSQVRVWTLEGPDINVLWSKRVVYNKSNPRSLLDVPLANRCSSTPGGCHSSVASSKTGEWEANSPDDVIVREILDHATDMAPMCSWDDTTIKHVGSPNPYSCSIIVSPGQTLASAMRDLTRMTQAIFYISPDYRVWHVDAETLSTDLVLTDHPTASNHVGYREFSWNSNGADLANDALLWGAAMGWKQMVFSRVEDSASIDEHGLWQWGLFSETLFCQNDADKWADSVVNGTPSHRRGHKDDQISFELVCFKNPGMVLQPGAVVTVDSQVFGFSGAFPIRDMTITFPTKETPKYRMALSFAADEPWSIYQSWFPKMGFPIPKVVEYPPRRCVSDGRNTGLMIDDFASGWSAQWQHQAGSYSGGGGIASVTSQMDHTGSGFRSYIGSGFSSTFIHIASTQRGLRLRFRKGSFAGSWYFALNDYASEDARAIIGYNGSKTYLTTVYDVPSPSNPDWGTTISALTDGAWYTLGLDWSDGFSTAILYDASGVEIARHSGASGADQKAGYTAPGVYGWTYPSGPITFDFDSLSNVSPGQSNWQTIEDWARSQSGGWGTSPSNLVWHVYVPATMAVSGGEASLTPSYLTGGIYFAQAVTSGVAGSLSEYTLSTKFKIPNDPKARFGFSEGNSGAFLLYRRDTGLLYGPAGSQPISITPGVWYKAELQVTMGASYCRVYEDGAAPGDWILGASTSYANPGISPAYTFGAQNTGQQFNVGPIDAIAFGANMTICAQLSGPGWISESISSGGSAAETSHPYVPGTLAVWDGGFRITPNEVAPQIGLFSVTETEARPHNFDVTYYWDGVS